jgi:group I intron endonuclease
MIGVYSITSPTGKVYVGSSKHIEVRWKSYKKLRCKDQTKIYRSLIKHGVDNHIFKVLIECEAHELYDWEHLWSMKYDTINKGLNCHIPAYGDSKGLVCKETVAKIRNTVLSGEYILNKLAKKLMIPIEDFFNLTNEQKITLIQNKLNQ